MRVRRKPKLKLVRTKVLDDLWKNFEADRAKMLDDLKDFPLPTFDLKALKELPAFDLMRHPEGTPRIRQHLEGTP